MNEKSWGACPVASPASLGIVPGSPRSAPGCGWGEREKSGNVLGSVPGYPWNRPRRLPADPRSEPGQRRSKSGQRQGDLSFENLDPKKPGIVPGGVSGQPWWRVR
jgi:hypothetical protein